MPNATTSMNVELSVGESIFVVAAVGCVGGESKTHRKQLSLCNLRRFAALASIEMIESISADQWPDLFETLSRVLRRGGIVAMQAITIDDQFYEQLTKREEFIKTYIFPGGDLPTMALLQRLAQEADLAWSKDSSHGADYAETLSRWASSFDAAWDDISSDSSLLDGRFKRMWHIRQKLRWLRSGRDRGADGSDSKAAVVVVCSASHMC
jgi:cyclopropane fatty-acyl-phospholipid synthase-like methyltransferase